MSDGNDRSEAQAAIASQDELSRLRAEHAVVVRALQEAIRDTTRLTRLFAVLNEAAPLGTLLDRVLATLSELFVADVVVLFDARREKELFTLASVGLPAEVENRKAATVASVHAAMALNSGAPVIVNDARKDPEVDAFLRDLDAAAMVWLRVCGDSDTCRGVLVLARCRPLPFVQSDVDLLKSMAYRIGLMVERAHAEDERRVLELKVWRAEKAESLGRMAAAVAHRFNNMLAVVVANVEIALDALPKNHPIANDLLCARESTRQAAKTSELMLAYLGQIAGNRESVELGRLLRDALPGLLTSLPSLVRCTSDLRDSGLMISASPPQIVQLLGSLLTNSWEAMAGGSGTIEVSLQVVPSMQLPRSQYPMPDWEPKASSYACLTVTDNGCGMAPETVEKIFDPFFSTKSVGRGLGLPVVLGIVRAYEGCITVESRRSLGSTFRVFLPLLPRVAQAKKLTISIPTALKKKQHLVLLAEDEAELRRSTQRIIHRLGYEVVNAADGLEALVRFRQRIDEVRFVVLDLAMPRMDGWTAFQAIRELRPDTPVLITSGYDEQHALREHTTEPLLAFLHKPYTLAEVQGAIEELLAMADGKPTPIREQ